jgi:hypothetical protein
MPGIKPANLIHAVTQRTQMLQAAAPEIHQNQSARAPNKGVLFIRGKSNRNGWFGPVCDIVDSQITKR